MATATGMTRGEPVMPAPVTVTLTVPARVMVPTAVAVSIWATGASVVASVPGLISAVVRVPPSKL